MKIGCPEIPNNQNFFQKPIDKGCARDHIVVHKRALDLFWLATQSNLKPRLFKHVGGLE